jgi:putative ABC transport system permease protein
MLPLNNVAQSFPRPDRSFGIDVSTFDPLLRDQAIGEATGLFRIIRGDRPGQEQTFQISRSDELAMMLTDNIKYVTMAATFIGLITLLGAAIGLMNIMLVSVTERTLEIGIRKAMGATPKTIRNQFLVEAVVIAQLGGFFGISFGILIGNVLSMILKTSFIVPWLWILLGVSLCFIVALVSGIIPANKAAKLDPIESLRYE